MCSEVFFERPLTLKDLDNEAYMPFTKPDKDLLDFYSISLSLPDCASFLDTLSKSPSVEIEKVIFNDPATIVFWSDGTKTIVKKQKEDKKKKFDKEKGLAMAISKKFFGNEGNYFEEFKKWCE